MRLVQQAYQLFKTYKAELPLDVCTDCCMEYADTQTLVALPVKDIPMSLLAAYQDGASTIKTPIHELKYFLPRYIDLAYQFNFPSHSLELTFRRLEPFDPAEWSTEEFNFLSAFADDFFQFCLSQYPLPSGENLVDILIMFWNGPFDLERLLNYWKNDESVTGMLHFYDLLMEGFEQFNPSNLANGFATSELSHQLRSWIDSTATKSIFSARIEALIMNDQTLRAEQTDKLSYLYEILIH